MREFLAQMEALGVRPEFKVYPAVCRVYVGNGNSNPRLESERILEKRNPTKCWNLNVRCALLTDLVHIPLAGSAGPTYCLQWECT